MIRRGWPDLVILVIAMVVAFAIVAQADRDFLREIQPRERPPKGVSRPNWLWELHYPYRRMQHDLRWVCVAATLGTGALLARDSRTWTRRGLSRPGTGMVFMLIVLGGLVVAHRLLLPPLRGAPIGSITHLLGNQLSGRAEGAVMGAWVVAWLGTRRQSRPDWRERTARVVGWMWLLNPGLLIGDAILFG